MKNIFAILIFIFSSFSLYAQQSIPFGDDFEGAINWTIVNGTETNKWVIGTAANNGGAKGIYISDNGGTTNSYNTSQPSTVHFYADFVNPFTSCVYFEFDWKSLGEFLSDDIKVYKATNKVIPVAGQLLVESDSVELLNQYHDNGIYTIASNPLAGYANDTIRLVFTWTNDNGGGTQPPAAIDNIFLYQQPGAFNDQPCNALPLSMGVIQTGDNFCSGRYDEPSQPGCFVNLFQHEINSVWYSFVAPSSGSIKVRTNCHDFFISQIELYGGVSNPVACDSGATLNFITCATGGFSCGLTSGANSMIAVTGLTSNMIYYVRVDGQYGAIGSFDIEVIDSGPSGTGFFNPEYGQDCAAPIPLCSDSIYIPDPGFNNFGNYCDFDTGYYCVASGERASKWYEITIANPGLLLFDIVPNNYQTAFPNDYDFVIWKVHDASGTVSCSQIAAGGVTPAACNYNVAGSTGCYTGGLPSPNYGGTIASYEPPISVLPGEVYRLAVLNYSLGGIGCRVIFTNTAPGVIDFCPTGIPETSLPLMNLNLFPNPVAESAMLTFGLTRNSEYTISVIDVLGQEVISSTSHTGTEGLNNHRIDCASLPSGVYFVVVNVEGQTFVRKLMK